MHSNPFSAVLASALVATSLFLAPAALAADETCLSCEIKTTFSGDFTHQRARGVANIEGAPTGQENSFREGIAGQNFTVTVSGLTEGKFTVSVGEIEVDQTITNAGQRVFDVLAGDQVLARNYDIVAAAQGAEKVQFITAQVDHQADSINGPLVLTFTGRTGLAKMNSIEVRDATGSSLLRVTAASLITLEDADQARQPVVAGPELWLDPNQPTAVRLNDLLSRMSLAEKVQQMRNNAPTIRRPGLELPAYNYWNEALHGVARSRGTFATVFPQAIGNGATWDTTKLKQVGDVIATEARALNNDYRARNQDDSIQYFGLTFWSPNINLFRDPRWGRGQETYGEDTFLTSRMGVAFIEGLQGDDPKYIKALACAKHYAVHSGPESLRHIFDAVPDERDFYESYLPHFEAAVREAHVGAVMSAYNSVYGEPAPSSTLLLTDLLRKTWGFTGHVVSDCDAVGDIYRNHLTNLTAAQAAARAVKGGTDLCCGQTYNNLTTSVKENLITPQEIDVALGRVLEARFRLGMFDPTNLVPYDRIPLSEDDTPAHRRLALDMARESLVLLKNNGILPLDRSKIKHIAVLGANADAVAMLYGNYNGTPSKSTTILAGIRALAGNDIDVSFTNGCPLALPRNGNGRPSDEAMREIIASVATADVIIYVGGINASLEGEEMRNQNNDGFSGGDRTRIELPAVQEDFIKALYATGKPVVFVNCSGSAMAVPWEAENLPAILQAWYPGEEGGTAVAEVLFGNYNPGGRLPVTFYRSTDDLPAFTNYSMANRTYRFFTNAPLFAFGHGLSYTKFDYARPSLSSTRLKASDTVKVTFTLSNTGAREGDEVAQVYFRHLNSARSQPTLALAAFGRVHLDKGRSARLTLDIPVERFRYWDINKKAYTVEAGDYELMIGGASDDIRQRAPFRVTAR